MGATKLPYAEALFSILSVSTPTPTTMGACSACIYFDAVSGNLCRFYPPASPAPPAPPHSQAIAFWPSIQQPDVDWCGEFSAIGAAAPAPYVLYVWSTQSNTTLNAAVTYPSQQAANNAAAQFTGQGMQTKVVPVGT